MAGGTDAFSGDEVELERFMSEPTARAIGFAAQLRGDVVILGIGGKIGVTLGMMFVRAIGAAGKRHRVYGVSRFTNPQARARLEAQGVIAVPCDLLDRAAVDALPDVPEVVFMAGRKFGTAGAEDATWAMNTIVPTHVAHRYRASRIVAFSTGCVYDFVPPASGGSAETDPPRPTGDYAQSALGRERVFGHFSRTQGTQVCILRLNYAIDPRYGVLHDIARTVYEGRPVDLSVGTFNCIWQGDVLERTMLSLGLCESPARVLNLTGPETVSVRRVALAFGERFGRTPVFTSEAGEGGRAYLNDASLSSGIFGYPAVTLHRMIGMQADWIASGGKSLDLPTHFQTTDGTY